jgi:nucleoside-triphosphatase THEP1
MTDPKEPTSNAVDGSGNKLDLKEALQRFNDTRVRHPAMASVVEDIMPHVISPPKEASVILVTGPTGVGKSTISRVLLRNMVNEAQEQISVDKSSIPFVSIEAYSNGETKHGFKQIYQDIAEQLAEPAMERKTPFEEVKGRLISRPGAKQTVAGLRRVVENALTMRRTRVLVIDEAAHLMRFGKDCVPMDTLKSLANTTNLVLVLVGSYDLLDMMTTHGQIARRSHILHFARYHIDKKSDREKFANIVTKLWIQWPFEERPNLNAVSDALMETSLGCVGLLKTAMMNMAAMQLRNKGRWKDEFFWKSVLSNQMLSVIRKETELGEKRVRDAVAGQTVWTPQALDELVSKLHS